ncbi:MAG: DUF1156 domain-containing protein, partial [Thermoflexales bacterium]|nr:DUF1156 domain-containing protein [Thermoflexales bacterium]
MTSHANGCPRLIEVALPIRELSAEGVRDKSLRHGHLSTLHLWWARRPLPVARAITFATLVPDPDHPHCPPEFRAAVERLLKTDLPSALKFYHRGRKALRDPDPYRPYDGLPDTPRNRLLAFIAKWSPEMRNFEAGKGALPKPEYLLDDRSLAKWETSDPTNPQGQAVLAIARALIRIANGGATPTVLDPFAGGGAIPLEAGRLGCQPIANDYNPVAYLVLRAGCEFPQRFGAARPLAEDVARWAGRALECARQRLGALYPPGADGAPVVGYLWARTIPCANPSCQAEIPLLRSLLVCDKSNKRVAVTMTPDPATKTIQFGIAKGKAIQADAGPKRQRGVAICPFCAQPTT